MITTHALGWALVDSLWQNALAAAGLAALLAIIPVRAARTRYAVAIVTLALMLALPAATAVRLSEMSPWTDDVVTATSTVAPGPTSGPGPQAAPTAPTAAAPVAARIRAALERSEEHTSSSHGYISYAVFCLKKKKELQSSPNRLTSLAHGPSL